MAALFLSLSVLDISLSLSFALVSSYFDLVARPFSACLAAPHSPAFDIPPAIGRRDVTVITRYQSQSQ